MTAPLLAIDDLRVTFHTDHGVGCALAGVSLEIRPGEILGLVGESGCGKSVLCAALLRLLPSPPAVIEGGSVRFEDRNLLTLAEADIRRLRGRAIAMVFQDPATALNPVQRCGDQVAEPLRLHHRLSQPAAAREAHSLLSQVGIPDPGRIMREYPHRLSGGLQQRVMIAMALSCGPRLLLADEPTTALDVTVQAQILALIRAARDRTGMAVLLVTHDLGVVADIADRVAVMYAGRIQECGPVHAVLGRPLHPYTRALLTALPGLAAPGAVLQTIPGTVPDAAHRPSGCPFHPRCSHADARCAVEEPPVDTVEPTHAVRCWLASTLPPRPGVTGTPQ